MAAPYYYNYINTQSGTVNPSTVHAHNTGLQKFYKRYLIQRAMSVFEWILPDNWDKDYTLYSIYCGGFVAVINTDRFGIIPQFGGLGGYDVFYRPSYVTIANPLLRNPRKVDISVNTELIRLQPDYGGILDIVNYYADMLALCAESAGMNLVNSHLSYVFMADNKAAAESFKKLFDQIASGETAVVYDKQLTADGKEHWQPFSKNLRESFIADDILQVMSKLTSLFDQDIGIPSVNNDKRERQVVDEVNKNNVNTYSLASLWKTTLDESIKKVNNMFDINVSCKWRFQPEEVSEGATDSDNSGLVSV